MFLGDFLGEPLKEIDNAIMIFIVRAVPVMTVMCRHMIYLIHILFPSVLRRFVPGCPLNIPLILMYRTTMARH